MKPLILLLATSVLLGPAGCMKREPAGVSGHHEHRAPHGGVLVELGEHQANLEIRFDAPRGILQAWVLDAHAENFVRVAQTGLELQATAGGRTRVVDLVAVGDTMTGETVGDTSLFEAPAEWLREAKAFDGRLKAITVRGNLYEDIAFHYHDDEAHDH